MMNIASIIFQAPAYGSSASRIYTPPGASGSIPASGVHQQGQIQSTTTYAINNQANPQSSTPGATGAQAVNSIMNNVLQPLWVLFAVQGSRPTLELDHISVSDACDDASFFKLVRRSHRRNRGRLLLWFSCWRLHHCDFVKVFAPPYYQYYSLIRAVKKTCTEMHSLKWKGVATKPGIYLQPTTANGDKPTH